MKSPATEKYKFLPLFFLIFTIIIYCGCIIDPVLIPRFVFLSVFLLFFAIYLLITKKYTIRSEILLLSFFIYLLFSFVTVIYSINKVDAIFEFLKDFLFFAVIITVSAFYKTEEFLKFFTRIITFLVALILLIGIYQLFFIENKLGFSHLNMYRVSSVFANKNIFSEYLLLLLPVTVFNISYQKRTLKIINIFNFIFSLFFITILLSRGVWGAVPLSLLVTFLFFLVLKNKNTLSIIKKIIFNKKTWIVVIVGGVIIALSVLFYAQKDSLVTFEKQMATITNLKKIRNEDRIQLWENTLSVISENPVFGSGLASWKINILKYGNKNLHSENNYTFYQRPHNDYLWILSEQGVLGLFLYLTFFVLLLANIVKVIKQVKDRNIKLFLVHITWLIFIFLVISGFNFPKERIEHKILLALVASFVIILKNDVGQNKHIIEITVAKKILWGIILFDVFAVIVGFGRFYGEYYLKKALKHRAKKEYAQVVTSIDKANSIFYKIDFFSTPLAWYSGEANFYLGKIDLAFKDFEQAYKINPYHIHVLNNLATCYELQSEHSVAIGFYKKALHIAPNFEEALFNICSVYYNLDNADSAFFYFCQIDTATANPKYNQYIFPVLRIKINSIINETQDSSQIKVLNEIRESDNWLKSIYFKALKNKISFRKQLILDVEYIVRLRNGKNN